VPYSTARVETGRPERYIKQLVAHLGRKTPAELGDDGRGTITLRQGRCELIPASAVLELTAIADDAEALVAVQDVVTRHLLRFATQEELTVTWSGPAA
jgi:caffeoyl-CoA O-methyltransferase